MHSSRTRSQTRIAPSLQGSLRASAAFISGSSGRIVNPLAEHLASAARTLGSVNESPKDTRPLSEDFEQISFDELRASFHFGDVSSQLPAYSSAFGEPSLSIIVLMSIDILIH